MAIRRTDKTNNLTEVHALAVGTSVSENAAVSVKLGVAISANKAIGIRIECLVDRALFARRSQTHQEDKANHEQATLGSVHRHCTPDLHSGFAG